MNHATGYRNPIRLLPLLGLLLMAPGAIAQQAAQEPAATPMESDGNAQPATTPPVLTDPPVERTASDSAIAPDTPAETAIPLARFMAEDRPMRLERSNGQYRLAIPLSERARIESAQLHLEFTNSISLLNERSQLRVRLNKGTIAQVPLRSESPQSDLDITIPGAFFKPGYNDLEFSVAQHYTMQCEDPSAPELWTEIDAVASTIAFDRRLRPLSPRLSELDRLIDPKLQQPQHLTILTAPADQLGDRELRWGSLLTQGAAFHLEYVSPRVSHAFAQPAPPPQDPDEPPTGHFPGLLQSTLMESDTLLVGTRQELTPFLAPQIAEQISDSFLGIYPLDRNPERFVLVISGTDDSEVERAALAFAITNYPFPDTESTLISDVVPPALGDYAGFEVIYPDNTYTFTELGYRTTTAKGIFERINLDLAVPPDLYGREDQVVKLRLHLAYGAALREDSVLNLFLNDNFESAIHLREPGGARFSDYQVAIPLRSFKPGHNRISFEISMQPWASGSCTHINTSNLLLTLFEDSELELPPALHLAPMPDLELLSRTGFPYRSQPYGQDTHFQVADRDSRSVAAAWTLIARLARPWGVPLYQSSYSFASPASNVNLLAIGTTGNMPDALKKAAPTDLSGPTSLRFSVTDDGYKDPIKTPWWERLFDRLAGFEPPLPPWMEPKAQANIVEIPNVGSGLGRYTLIHQFEYPAGSATTATLIMADDSERLSRGINALIDQGIWDQLRGDIAIWRSDEKQAHADRIGAVYGVGDAGPSSKMQLLYSIYPWLWLATLGVAALLFTMLTIRLLNRFRNTHHSNVSDEEKSEGKNEKS